MSLISAAIRTQSLSNFNDLRDQLRSSPPDAQTQFFTTLIANKESLRKHLPLFPSTAPLSLIVNIMENILKINRKEINDKSNMRWEIMELLLSTNPELMKRMMRISSHYSEEDLIVKDLCDLHESGKEELINLYLEKIELDKYDKIFDNIIRHCQLKLIRRILLNKEWKLDKDKFEKALMNAKTNKDSDVLCYLIDLYGKSFIQGKENCHTLYYCDNIVILNRILKLSNNIGKLLNINAGILILNFSVKHDNQGFDELLQLLLKYKVDISKTVISSINIEGMTALDLICMNGHHIKLELLLKYLNDSDLKHLLLRSNLGFITPLGYCKYDRSNKCELIIKRELNRLN